MEPLILRGIRAAERALHEIQRLHHRILLERDVFARPRELAHLLNFRALIHAGESKVRSERPPLELESQRFACELHIVVQQFQSRLLLDAHPYDSRATKVRKSSDMAERNGETAVPRYDLVHRCSQSW